MARKKVHFKDERVIIENEDAPSKERLAFFTEQFAYVYASHPSANGSSFTCYSKGTLVFDEEIIDQLIARNAPILVYKRDL